MRKRLTDLRGVLRRGPLTTCGELAGTAVAVGGVWDFSRPLGLISAGVSLVFFSWLVGE